MGTAIERVSQHQAEQPAPVNDDPVEWAQWIVAAMFAAAGGGGLLGPAVYTQVIRPRRIAKAVERGELDFDALSERLAAKVLKHLHARPTITQPARRGPDLG